MSVENGERLATKQDLKDMYDRIRPYMGGLPEVVANKFSKGDLYSTDEKMIGQWVDSKPLYQKVFSVVDTGNSSTHTITIPSTLNIESVVYFKAEKVCEGYGISIPYTESNHVITVSKPVTSGDIVFTKDTATVWIGTYYLTMKYTKTTDSAISIGDDTDYSTEEKIIGTWIDGKPIYQKTIQTTAPNCVTYGVIVEKAINLNVALDKIIKVEGFVYDDAIYVCMPINSALQNSKDAVYMIRAYCSGNGASSNPNSIVIGNSIKDYNNKPCYVTVQYTKTT